AQICSHWKRWWLNVYRTGCRNSRNQFGSANTIKLPLRLGLILDYSRSRRNDALLKLATDAARKFFLQDRNCPLAYEPSGEDFLSPCLGEADVMRRVLSPNEYGTWLSAFLPQIPAKPGVEWLSVVVSPDPSDPKLAHLDGLNLSRAWMLEGMVSGLP